MTLTADGPKDDAKNTLAGFVEEYGTRSAGLAIASLVSTSEGSASADEEAELRRMAGDLIGALKAFARESGGHLGPQGFVARYGARSVGEKLEALVGRAEDRIDAEDAAAVREMFGDLAAALVDVAAGTEIADAAVPVEERGVSLLGSGFQRYERHSTVSREPGGPVEGIRRDADILRAGQVVGVLPIDLKAGKVVLLRQFRYAAHLATGRGMLVEMIAGRVDKNECPEDAARRECVEEIGVSPRRLVRLFRSMPSPGLTDEIATLFAASVDSDAIAAQAGLADEYEHILPFTASFDAALGAIERGAVTNSLLIQGLQWLAINRGRLHTLAG